MARARNIKPGFFQNEHLAQLPFETRLLFIGLWTLADRDGRLEDRPTRIKMQLFGADSIDVVACLDQLANAGEPFIRRYVVGDVPLIEIVNFTKHQRPHKNEPAVHPAPTDSDQNPSGSDQNPSGSGNVPTRSRQTAKRSIQVSVRGNQQSGFNQEGNSNQVSVRGNQQSGKSPTDTPETVFAYFVASNAPTKPRDLTPSRRNKLVTRLKSTDWPWREAIDKLPIPNDKGFTFQPDLDWLIENDTNARKVAEGRYDRSGPQTRTRNNLAAVEDFAHGQ